MRDGFHDVGCHQHLEAEQQRAADADLVDVGILLTDRLPQLANSGPGDADHDDENAEDLDPAPDRADGVVDGRLEGLECVHIVHVRASGGSKDAAYSVLRRRGNRFAAENVANASTPALPAERKLFGRPPSAGARRAIWFSRSR